MKKIKMPHNLKPIGDAVGEPMAVFYSSAGTEPTVSVQVESCYRGGYVVLGLRQLRALQRIILSERKPKKS